MDTCMVQSTTSDFNFSSVSVLPMQVVSQKKVSEEMLSSQMLSGIPEVDLGVE